MNSCLLRNDLNPTRTPGGGILRVSDTVRRQTGGRSTVSMAASIPVSNRKAAARGYTLLEVLVVMMIIGIAAAWAVPSLTRLLNSSKVAANLDQLASGFELARSEALARNTLVLVCRSGNPGAATPSCSNAAVAGIAADDWASGWLIYALAQGNETVAAFNSANDTLLRRFQPEGVRPAGDRVLIKSNPAPAAIVFAGSGLRFAAGGQVPIFTLDHRDPSTSTASDLARCLRLSVSGRIRAGKVLADGTCDA